MKKSKRIENPNRNSDTTQSRHMDGILHRKMRHDYNEKQEITHNGRKKKQEKNAQRKENLLVPGNIGSRQHQINGEKRKNLKKDISGEWGNYSKPNYIAEISSKR